MSNLIKMSIDKNNLKKIPLHPNHNHLMKLQIQTEINNKIQIQIKINIKKRPLTYMLIHDNTNKMI